MTAKVSRLFRPSISGTLALFMLTGLFASLGMWQAQRAAEKEQTELRHRMATRVSFETALAKDERFARIDVSGHYDPVRHILLDNQIWKGRAGVHVFTPFYTLDGTAILVNRGWLALTADRQTMPAVPTPQHETVLRGMLNTLPVPGRMLGQADRMNQSQWPQLVTYLNLENITESLDVPLENRIIQLSASEQAGFEGRDWKPVFLTSRKHKAYAFQWFALATVSIVLWVFTGFRKPSGINK
jgi:cytochrome oxidase assembly protein ShyY1